MVLAVLVAIVALDRLREALTTRVRKVTESSDVYPLPPPVYVKVASLGYRDAAASLLWASTLYQYGDHVSHNRRFEYPTQYIETILELDPAFRPAYRFVATLTTMQISAPSREQIDRALRVLENGTQELPNDPETWGAYASFLMFEGAQYLPEAEKMRWRVKGARAAQRAVELGYFMDSLAYTGALFLERAGERDLAIRQLERAYAVAPNDELREKIALKLKRLQAEDGLAKMQSTQRALLRTWQQRYPWLNESLFILVGVHPNSSECAGLAGVIERCSPGFSGFSAGVH